MFNLVLESYLRSQYGCLVLELHNVLRSTASHIFLNYFY